MTTPSPERSPLGLTRVSIGIAIVVVLGLIGLWWFSRGSIEPGPAPTPTPSPSPSPTLSPSPGPSPSPTTSPSPTPTPEPTPKPEPLTLLWQVRDDRYLAVDNVLIGTRTDDVDASEMFLPGGLLVDAGASGETTLARTAILPDTLASPRSVSNALGVKVTGAFVLDRLAFAGLVDAVDGVWIWTTGGPKHLNGPAAADYVLTRVPGESEAVGIQKFKQVLDSVFLRLPDSEGEMRMLVTSLGVLARTTIPTAQVVAILTNVHAAAEARAVNEETIPTSVLRPGVESIDVLVQPAALRMTVRLFPLMILHPGEAQPPRVMLRSATPDVVSVVDARAAIVGAGLQYVSGGRLANGSRTHINVPDESAASRAVGETVAQALGLPSTSIVAGDMTNPTVDVEVTLGTDWKPKP